MKKNIIVITILSLFLPFSLKAECSYENEKELSELSVYIDYTYEYNEETESFDIKILNLQNLFIVEYNSKKYSTNDGETLVISNIKLGQNLSMYIKGSGYSNCPSKSFRTLSISLPYLNPYYGSEKCEGYEKLSVCYSKFLNFEISSNTFKNALERSENSNSGKTEDNTNKILTSIFKFFTENYIKILLVVITTGVWLIIYKNKYRKSKHGF